MKLILYQTSGSFLAGTMFFIIMREMSMNLINDIGKDYTRAAYTLGKSKRSHTIIVPSA